MRLTDLELLGVQAEGSFDPRRRVIGMYGVTIACAEGRQELWIGAEVPDALAAEVAATFEDAPPSSHPSEPPPALERCARLLDAGDRCLQRTAGPSFLIPPDAYFASGARLERSDASNGAALRNANPGNWHPVEWDELLDGRLGPWAIATEGGVIVSICHTPGPLTGRAAECGVWTHPAFRGRGHAAATTSAWAAIVRPSGRHLFYSTDAENLSSQRVARRLGLRALGWTWRLGHARDGAGEAVHPLSTVRRPR
jgi:hypothetical protein